MSEIDAEIASALEATPGLEEDIASLRDELINLSKSGEIDKTVPYLKKANKKAIKKIHKTAKSIKLVKTNEIISEMLVNKWVDALGWFNLVKDPDSLNGELHGDALLKSDLIRAVSLVTPYLPLPGLISGAITTAKHMLSRETNTNVCDENSPCSNSTT